MTKIITYLLKVEIGDIFGWPPSHGRGHDSVGRYEGELAPSVEADGFFDALVPFERLLGI